MKKYQIVYKDLEKAIHCQKYQVGDFLLTEQELVETFKVSRYTPYERHCLYSSNKVWLKRFMGQVLKLLVKNK